ncbi:hypothetical protein U9012_08415, partial [Escherichia coli]
GLTALTAEFTVGEGKLMTHDEPCSMAPDDKHDLISGTCSHLPYVLLGKVYEMKGMNREAADAYLTAFNLRPGANTLYWIENGIFQTSVPYVVPYLDKFLASE